MRRIQSKKYCYSQSQIEYTSC